MPRPHTLHLYAKAWHKSTTKEKMRTREGERGFEGFHRGEDSMGKRTDPNGKTLTLFAKRSQAPLTNLYGSMSLKRLTTSKQLCRFGSVPPFLKYSNGDDYPYLRKLRITFTNFATTRVGAASALNLVFESPKLGTKVGCRPREGQQESVSFNRLESQNHMPKLPT